MVKLGVFFSAGTALVGSLTLSGGSAQAAEASAPGAAISHPARLSPAVNAALGDKAFGATLTITSNGQTTTTTLGDNPGVVRPDSNTYGPKSFTTSSPSFSASDAEGRQTGQVTFNGSWPMAWSYKILSPYAALATSTVTESADYYANGTKVSGYHYGGKTQSVDYLFHSTTPANNGGVPYILWGTYVWKWTSSSASGTAQIDAYFKYTVTGSTHCGSPQTGHRRPNC